MQRRDTRVVLGSHVRFMGKEKSHQLFRTVNGSQVQGRIALLVLGSNIRPAAEQ